MMEGRQPACKGCGYPVDLEVDLQCRRCGSFAHFECAEVAPETDIRRVGIQPDEDYNCSVCRSENQSMDQLRSGHGRQLSQTRQATSNTSHIPNKVSQNPNRMDRSPSRRRHGIRQARQSHSTSPAGRKMSHASGSAGLASQESRRANNERSRYNASLTRYNTTSNEQPGECRKTSGKRVTIRESEEIRNRRNYDCAEDEGIPFQMNQQQVSGQFPIRQGILSQPCHRKPYETFPCEDPNDIWNHLSSFVTQEPRICHRRAHNSTNQPPTGCSRHGHWASTLPHHVDQQQIHPGAPRQNYFGVPQQCHFGSPQISYPGASQQCYLGAQRPGRPLVNDEVRSNCPMQIAGVTRFDPLQATCRCEGSWTSQPSLHSQPCCTDQRGAGNWSTNADCGSACRAFKERTKTTKPPRRDTDIGKKETGKNSARMADNHYQDGIRSLRSGFSPGTQSPRVDESQSRGENHEPEVDIVRAYSDQRRRSWSTSDDVSQNQVREKRRTYSSGVDGPQIPKESYETEPDSQQRCFEPLLTSTRIGYHQGRNQNANTNGFPLQNEGFAPQLYVDRSYSELPTGPRKTSNSALEAYRNQCTSNLDQPSKKGDSVSARRRKAKTDPCEKLQFENEPGPNLIRGSSSCGLGMRPSRSFYSGIGPTSTPNQSGLGPSQLDYGGMGPCQPVLTEMGPPTPNSSGMFPRGIGTAQASCADIEFPDAGFSVVGPSESFYLGLRTPQPVYSDSQNCCADNPSGVLQNGPTGRNMSNEEDQPQETRSKMEICEDMTTQAIETLSKLKKASSKVASADIEEDPPCSEVHSVSSVDSGRCTKRDWMAKQARTYRQLDEIAAKIAAMEKKNEHLLDDSGEKSMVRRQRSVHFASDCDVDENLKEISVKLDTMENNQLTLSSSWLQQLKGFKAYTEAVQMRLCNLEQRTRMLEEKGGTHCYQLLNMKLGRKQGGRNQGCHHRGGSRHKPKSYKE